MRRNRISKLIPGKLVPVVALFAAVAALSSSGQAYAATPAPHIELYKDASPTSTPELKPYGDNSEQRSSVSFAFHVEASDVGSYAVYLSTPDSALRGRIEGNTDTIDNLSAGSTSSLADLPDNTWAVRYADDTTATKAASAVESKDYEAVKVVPTGITVTSSNAITIGGSPSNSNSVTRYYAIDVAAAANSSLTPDTYTGTIVLSAVATPKSLATSGTFQDFTIAKCEALAKGTSTTLEDSRDGKVYLVSRLNDGNCWMTQNLALEGDTVIHKTDSNITADSYTLPSSSTTFVNNDSTYNSKQMFNGSHQDGQPDTAGCNSATPITGCTGTSGTSGNNNNNSGAYYSWLVATAQDTNSDSTNYKNIATSICPKGWTLPSAYGANSAAGTSNSSADGQLNTLYKAYNSNATSFKAAWAPLGFAGYFYTNGLGLNGTSGRWWSSSTASGGTSAFFLNEDSSNVSPASGQSRYLGFSVRCVFEMPKPKTMQNMTLSDCGDGTAPVTVQDSRDNKLYLVQKLADGNCWMVQNLALEGGTRLNSTDSNLNSGQTYTLPTSSQSFAASNSDTTPHMFNGSHLDATYDTAGCWPTGSKTVAGYCTASNKTGDNNNNPGAYYSWDAATAGKYTSAISVATEATQSICPKNWILPTGSTSDTEDKSFNKLWAAYNKNKSSFDNVWHPGYTGSIYTSTDHPSSSLSSSGSFGMWWSNTAGGWKDGYANFYDSTNGTVSISHNAHNMGYSVRCVFAG